MLPLWSALLGGSFVFLDVSPSILFLVFALVLGALGYFMIGRGFIISTGALCFWLCKVHILH
jgi:hypothetical protein